MSKLLLLLFHLLHLNTYLFPHTWFTCIVLCHSQLLLCFDLFLHVYISFHGPNPQIRSLGYLHELTQIKQELVTGYIWHFSDGSRANCCCLQFAKFWFITTENATCTVTSVVWWTKWSLKNCYMLLSLECIPQISLFWLFSSSFLKGYLSWHVLQSWSVWWLFWECWFC